MSKEEEFSLHELGLKYRLDKAYAHEYTLDFYPRHLQDIRHSATLIAEVGIWDGGSLRMWGEYFSQARLMGIDINLSRIQAPIPRASLHYADQSKPDELRMAFADVQLSSVDLIIEDGMHSSHCQQICLGALFPYVRPGGRYIIEDLQTSVSWPREQEETITSLAMVQAMQRTGAVQSEYLSAAELEYIQSHLGEVDVYTRTSDYAESVAAILYKRI